MTHWFTLEWYKYLFTDLKDFETIKEKIVVIVCRSRGHKDGNWIHLGSCMALEPQYHCSKCYDRMN